MKHYTKMKNGDEYDLLDPRTRRYVGHKAKFLAKTKAEYRRRERAALKRMTAELVDDELHGRRCRVILPVVHGGGRRRCEERECRNQGGNGAEEGSAGGIHGESFSLRGVIVRTELS